MINLHHLRLPLLLGVSRIALWLRLLWVLLLGWVGGVVALVWLGVARVALLSVIIVVLELASMRGGGVGEPPNSPVLHSAGGSKEVEGPTSLR